MKLLLVEDDAPLAQALQRGLELLGHSVVVLPGARGFEAMLRADRWDAVVLDLTLPDGDGIELLRAMRSRRDATPVIVVSARGDRSDRIGLLDEGADDYLTKPVDLDELSARLRAITRRSQRELVSGAPLRHGALRADPASGTVSLRGRALALRERERWLLMCFLRQPDHVFTRAQLEAVMPGAGRAPDSNAVEVYVHHLRRKIASDIIVTVRGLGYRLGPPPPES
jgi:two-component system response regulator QseB